MSAPVVRDRRGDVVALGEELGAGGEGSVFAIAGRPGLCAKIYRADKAGARAEKIESMLARRPSWLLRGGIAWPVEALFGGDAGAFVGFVMPLRKGMIELHRLLVPDERMAVAGWLSARDLCRIAARIAKLVAAVHRAGHVVGDLKPQNILVSPISGRVSLIDTDSFQIRDRKRDTTHRSVVVTPEYTPPELWGVDLAGVDRTPAADDFALAVLAHQILLGGAHPFEGELTAGQAGSVERIPGRIRRGLSPMVPGIAGIRPAAGALSVGALAPELRALFVATFGEGHAAPSRRTRAAAWHAALERASGAMTRCPASRAHEHDRALDRCPWCERRERTGIDLFPGDQRWQRALLEVPDPRGAPEASRAAWLAKHVEGRVRAGKVTPAERAWLEKTGAALGFDRARVGRSIDEVAALRARTLGERLRLLRLPAMRLPRLSAMRLPRLPAMRLPRLPAMRPPGQPATPETRTPDLPATSFRARLRELAPRRGRLLLSLVSAAAAGAVATRVLATSEPEGSPRPACAVAAQQAVIGNTRGRGAHMREAPSTSSGKTPLSEGTVVRLTGRTTTGEDLQWSEVEVLGRSGWVASRYLVEPR